MKNNQIFKRVYTVGELADGVHGEPYWCGNAVVDIIIFGIKADDEAANLVKHHKNSDNDALPML